MKTLFISLLICLSSSAFALNNGTVRIDGNRVISYESELSNGKGPHFVLLPGIYRGLRSEDAFVQALVAAKVSFVTFHFAEQPDSVAKTSATKEPDFSKITTADLAAEVDALVDHLKIKGTVIPVTLSYSGTVTPYLNPERYPVVIEASPLGTDTDTLPQGWVQMMKAWEAWMKWNPLGAIWVANAKAAQLRQHWTPWVNSNAERTPELKNPTYRERAFQGYQSLSLAAEGFDLRNEDFAAGPQRYFILGANEEAQRSAIQQEAIEMYQKQTGHKNNVIVIKEAGHIVMSDQPEAFIKALKKIGRIE
jgi:pimeloyl-ACP methyl ester carboxylesterase